MTDTANSHDDAVEDVVADLDAPYEPVDPGPDLDVSGVAVEVLSAGDPDPLAAAKATIAAKVDPKQKDPADTDLLAAMAAILGTVAPDA